MGNGTVQGLKPAEKREQENLLMKRRAVVKSTADDKMLVEIDFNGLIDIKEGGKVHSVCYDSFDWPRSDGKMMKITVSAYYK